VTGRDPKGLSPLANQLGLMWASYITPDLVRKTPASWTQTLPELSLTKSTGRRMITLTFPLTPTVDSPVAIALPEM
jgi:hypothetical protein